LHGTVKHFHNTIEHVFGFPARFALGFFMDEEKEKFVQEVSYHYNVRHFLWHIIPLIEHFSINTFGPFGNSYQYILAAAIQPKVLLYSDVTKGTG
jgi:hypothetical protein